MHTSLLRTYRTNALLTVRSLAELSGVNPATISRIECGRTKPTDITKVRLARALGVSAYDIFPINEDAPV